MVSGKVVGTIVSTRKVDTLVGSKFLEVRLFRNGEDTDEYLIAIDTVGAGIGEKVLLPRGAARGWPWTTPKHRRMQSLSASLMRRFDVESDLEFRYKLIL